MEHLKKACALAETELAKRIASNNLALGCESGGAEIIVEALEVAYAAGVSEAEIQQANRILMRGVYHSHCLSVTLTLIVSLSESVYLPFVCHYQCLAIALTGRDTLSPSRGAHGDS